MVLVPEKTHQMFVKKSLNVFFLNWKCAFTAGLRRDRMPALDTSVKGNQQNDEPSGDAE